MEQKQFLNWKVSKLSEISFDKKQTDQRIEGCNCAKQNVPNTMKFQTISVIIVQMNVAQGTIAFD